MHISEFTIEVNGVKLPLKRQKFSDWVKKFRHTLFMSDTL